MKLPPFLKIKAIIAFSGGETSAYMCYMLLKYFSGIFDFTVVFANTGKERPETLDFVNTCDKVLGFGTVWIEAVTNKKHGKGVDYKIVTYETAARNGEPFEAMIAKHGIPSKAAPMCTRELKTYAINAYVRGQKFRYAFRAIGMRNDEIDRIKDPETIIKERVFYPLFHKEFFPTAKKGVNEFWTDAALHGIDGIHGSEFRLFLQDYEGNCDMCFKKSLAKLLRLIREDPTLLYWWEEMEDKYADYIPKSRPKQKKQPTYFFRGNMSAKTLRYLASLTDDEVKKILKIKNLETAYNGCSESCEAI